MISSKNISEFKGNSCYKPINPLMGAGNYGATSNNMKLVVLLDVPNVTTHPSTASIPITVLYNGPLLCGLNVPIKGLTVCP